MSSLRILDTINRHSLNRSKTKEMHAFGKAPRFPKDYWLGSQNQEKEYSPHRNFEIDLNMHKSVSKSGREQRFSQRNYGFGPKSLTSPSKNLSQPKKTKKGISFARAKREQRKENHNPGPGQYQSQQSFHFQRGQSQSQSQSRSKSKSRSRKQSQTIFSRQDFAYPHQPVHSPRFGHTKGIKIGNSKRFWYEVKETPSPTHYNTGEQSAPKFKSINFKHQNGVTFPKSQRKGFLDKRRLTEENTTPGPGSYENDFSEFTEASRRILERVRNL